MKIDFDPLKNAKNIQERGFSFERVAKFDFESAQSAIDTQCDYGETRYRALGLIE